MRVAIHSVACCQDLSFHCLSTPQQFGRHRVALGALSRLNAETLESVPLPSLAGLKAASPMGTLLWDYNIRTYSLSLTTEGSSWVCYLTISIAPHVHLMSTKHHSHDNHSQAFLPPCNTLNANRWTKQKQEKSGNMASDFAAGIFLTGQIWKALEW